MGGMNSESISPTLTQTTNESAGKLKLGAQSTSTSDGSTMSQSLKNSVHNKENNKDNGNIINSSVPASESSLGTDKEEK